LTFPSFPNSANAPRRIIPNIAKSRYVLQPLEIKCLAIIAAMLFVYKTITSPFIVAALFASFKFNVFIHVSSLTDHAVSVTFIQFSAPSRLFSQPIILLGPHYLAIQL
jgi:hypothetical protein